MAEASEVHNDCHQQLQCHFSSGNNVPLRCGALPSNGLFKFPQKVMMIIDNNNSATIRGFGRFIA